MTFISAHLFIFLNRLSSWVVDKSEPNKHMLGRRPRVSSAKFQISKSSTQATGLLKVYFPHYYDNNYYLMCFLVSNFSLVFSISLSHICIRFRIECGYLVVYLIASSFVNSLHWPCIQWTRASISLTMPLFTVYKVTFVFSALIQVW